MTCLFIVLIPKSSYFQNILLVLSLLTRFRHNYPSELFLAEINERITEGFKGRWMQRIWLYCVEYHGQIGMDVWIYAVIICYVSFRYSKFEMILTFIQ
jgi:hypothetical protein